MLTSDNDIGILSVRSSVRLSVTLYLYRNGLKYHHSFFQHVVALYSTFDPVRISQKRLILSVLNVFVKF